MTRFLLLFVLMLTTLLQAKDPLTVGEAAPAPEVTTHAGETLKLAELYAAGPVLVYFYPKADTPGCTKQACNLRDHFAELEEAGIRVLGVSNDKVKAQADFRKKYNLPFTLIADAEDDKALAKGFQVGSRLGFYARQSFLVVGGKIAWRDLRANPKTQAEAALAAYRSL